MPSSKNYFKLKILTLKLFSASSESTLGRADFPIEAINRRRGLYRATNWFRRPPGRQRPRKSHRDF
jgi:hypothetical protein